MKSKTAFIAVIATSLLAVPALAQENNSANTDKTATETPATPSRDMKFRQGPVDLEKFSRLDDLKAADSDGDGVLSRAEIEALAQKRIVSRAADRMERRLDINGDGKVTLAEIENQRKKEFAALDRNEDGKIDRSEMRAAKMHHARGSHKGPHHMGHHKGPMKGQAETPQE